MKLRASASRGAVALLAGVLVESGCQQSASTHAAFEIRGTVTGLAGTGLTLASPNQPDLVIPPGAAEFAFATPLPDGGYYAVTVAMQPTSPWQTCTVRDGTGTVTDATPAQVKVTCRTNEYTLGGTISGLSGNGLTLATPGEPNLVVPANSTDFAFADPLPSGTSFSVSVAAQPASPEQTCTVTGGSGSVTNTPVSSVAVVCTTRTFALGGTISGLSGSGLTLATPGIPPLVVPPGATSFTFPEALPSGGEYSVTITSAPASPQQGCTVAGGEGTIGAAAVSSVAVYCPFTAWGQMTTARFDHTATPLPDGRLLIAGGSGTELPCLDSAEIYDPGPQTFTPTSQHMTTPRCGHTATLLSNGLVLIAGGDWSASGLPTTGTAELYDPVHDTFTPAGNLTGPRRSHTATLLGNGKVLLVGSISYTPEDSTAELYDPLTGTFSATGSLVYPYGETGYGHAATLLPNGTVLVTGGYGGSSAATSAAAWLYSPDPGDFKATGLMHDGHYRHTSTLLQDGRVLVQGGYKDTGAHYSSADAELYEPATGDFAVVSEPAPSGPRATLLNDGRVLVAGRFAVLFAPASERTTKIGSLIADRSEGSVSSLLQNGRVLFVGGRCRCA